MNYASMSRDKAALSASRKAAPNKAAAAVHGLHIGQPNDFLEREADRAANEVLADRGTRLGWSLSKMDMAAPLQRKCDCSAASGTHCEECKKKDKEKEKMGTLHRRAIDSATPSEVPSIVYEVLNSPGRPLDSATRRFFEPRFGHDFGRVRIHIDSRAAESARAVNAQAWTVGQEIIFAQGRYAPETPAGKNLLAHELAHTIQQRGVPRPAARVAAARDAEYHHLERDANSMAAAAKTGKPAAAPRQAKRPTLSRADEDQNDPNVTNAPKTAVKPVTGSIGGQTVTHNVKPTQVYAGKVKDSSGAEAIESLEEFEVTPFFLPAEKGPNALAIYEKMQGKGLESTLALQGSGKTKTALWQERPPTDDLRDLWLQKVNWTKGSANDLWQGAGGAKEFPKIGTVACQMDHIVELQIGGNNTPENMQPLDAKPNQSSGGQIKSELTTLAVAISGETDLSSGSAKQIKMRFTKVEQVGKPQTFSDCPPKGTPVTCLDIENCAKGKADDAKKKTDDRVDYPISAGGRETKLKVATTFATSTVAAAIEKDDLNAGASTLIPGLLLTELAHKRGKSKPDYIKARIDDREKTRLPISLNKNAGEIHLDVSSAAVKDKPAGDLTLDAKSKKMGLGFTYKYLSPGKITEIGVDKDGETTWKGTITPVIPFLGTLGVEYSKGLLTVSKGLDEEALKKKSVLGMRLTKAQIEMQLGPDFMPKGVVEMQMGPANAPVAQASLTVSADSIGLVAAGKLKFNIPHIQAAEADISYKGGGERNDWLTQIHIQSDAIKLPSATVSGSLDGSIQKGDISFAGKINAVFPGGNTAELGLKKDKDDWVFSGSGTFNFPKLDPTTVTISYSLGKEELTATGKTGFNIPTIGLSGHLDHVKFVLGKDLDFAKAKVSGTGGLKFKKGKAEGDVKVTLNPNGKFSGTGSLTYALRENLIVTGTVELNEQQKLRVTGELLLTRYELFKQYGDKKDLFSLDMPIPIPGLSIGDTGLVFHVRAGVGVAYSFGPGTIEPLKFAAGFDPLEDDKNVEFTVTGSVKVPASATLSAAISGSLAVQINAYVASAGAEGGLQLQGDLTLSAGAFANLDAAYKAKRLTAKVVAGIDTKLLLGLSLTAFARAWAGAFGITGELRKDWTLAKKTIDTGVGFYLSAPFEYADDTGIKLPELKDITLRKPDFNFSNILTQVFGSAQTKEKKS